MRSDLAILGMAWLLGPSGAFAQCNLVVSSFQHSVGCQSATVQVQVAGGTAPFSYAFTSPLSYPGVSNFNGSSTSSTYSDTEPMWIYCNWNQQVQVTVSDAMGCTATATSGGAYHWAFQTATKSYVHDCAQGGYRLRFGVPGLCAAVDWPLYINGAYVGTVGALCASNGSFYDTNQIYASGTYAITFGPNGGGDFSCGTGETCCPNGTTQVVVPAWTAPGDCGANFRMRAALDGALPSGTIMTDGLRAAGLLPLAEPYSALGFAYTGSPSGASTSPALLAVSGNDAIVDWVVVEVRNTTAPYAVVYSQPALLQRDGDVVDLDGADYIATPLAAGNYHLAMRHRNHLGVMTGSARTLSSDPSAVSSLVDFSAGWTTTYGTNARKQVGAVWCLWTGDVTRNGIAAYTGAGNDRDPILVAIGGSTPTATLTGQYRLEDVNLDGVVKYTGLNNDRDVILQNIGGATPTATRAQQLP